MDDLRGHEIEHAKASSPEERAIQALEAMKLGLRLKRMNLRRQFPDATEDQIERHFRAWLANDA